jgi:type IV pilus assembly protein PilV
MSVGVLGAAHLLVTSKQGNLEALDRTQAALYANSLIERMRANPLALGIYTNSGGGRTITAAPSTASSCSSGCTREELAQFDLDEFSNIIFGKAEILNGTPTGGLTTPTICVSGPDGGNGFYAVAIAWRGMNRLSNPTATACGQGSGLYGSGADADVYRRVLFINTYIGQPL